MSVLKNLFTGHSSESTPSKFLGTQFVWTGMRWDKVLCEKNLIAFNTSIGWYPFLLKADTFMRKTTFPEGDASNNQLARYLYYTGRYWHPIIYQFWFDRFWCFEHIRSAEFWFDNLFLTAHCQDQGCAIGVHRCLPLFAASIAQSTTAKCTRVGFPWRFYQNWTTKFWRCAGLGFLRFRKTVYKFSTIVQLLLGEIPDRSIFSQKVFLHLHWCWFANPNFSAGDDCSFEAISPHRSGRADFPCYDDKNALFDARFEQAVRVGDLGAFHEAMATFSDGFKTDKTCDSWYIKNSAQPLWLVRMTVIPSLCAYGTMWSKPAWRKSTSPILTFRLPMFVRR